VVEGLHGPWAGGGETEGSGGGSGPPAFARIHRYIPRTPDGPDLRLAVLLYVNGSRAAGADAQDPDLVWFIARSVPRPRSTPSSTEAGLLQW